MTADETEKKPEITVDALPESVREALVICDRDIPDVAGNGAQTAWGYIRAELLRLTARVQELERLEESALRALYRWIPRIRDDESPEMKSAYNDAAMLLRAPLCDDEPEHGEAILLRAERAESELAAIRKRIADDAVMVAAFVLYLHTWCDTDECPTEFTTERLDYLRDNWVTGWIPGLSEEHCGDCTKAPMPCLRCNMEQLLSDARKLLGNYLVDERTTLLPLDDEAKS